MLKFIILKIFALCIVLSNIDGAVLKELPSQDPVKSLKQFENPQDILLLKDSAKFKAWVNSTGLFHGTGVCVFNVTNAEDILLGAKPVLNETCYRFKQERRFKVFGWVEDEKFVRVQQNKFYLYISSKKLNDEITTLNIPLLYFYNNLETLDMNDRNQRSLKKRILERLNIYPLFVKRNVGDLLFRGYTDNLLLRVPSIEKIYRSQYIKLDIPDEIYSAKETFSLVGPKMREDIGIMKVNTGKFNINDLGQIVEINGKNQSDCWFNDRCNAIRGTDGVVHNPLIKQKESINIYVPDMKRAVDLTKIRFNKQSIRRFVWPNDTFSSSVSSNDCYFDPSKSENDKDGILRKPNTCNSGVPIVYSFPHFLGADAKYANQVIGLNANKMAHESYIDLEAETGNLIFERRNLQINFDTKAMFEARRVKSNNQTSLIFPVYWFCDNSYLDKKSSRVDE